MSSTEECGKVTLKHNLNSDISLWLGIYHDISLTTGLYEKYIPIDSFDLRC